jgi:hypothetical protein
MQSTIKIRSSTYFDACTVKGYFGDHYPEISDLTMIIYPNHKYYTVEIKGTSPSDRTEDFERSQDHLFQHNKCLSNKIDC